VVIPTWNEAARLPVTLEALARRAAGPRPEVIVADSGSTDGTRALARRLGPRLFPAFRLIEAHGPRGRSTPANAGAAVATGDVLLFLDADTVLPPAFDRLVARALAPPDPPEARPGDRPTVAGAFEFALDGPELRLRLVELVDRIRYRISSFHYGDQGLFCRAEAFRAVGGFPETGLFESAELCRRLKRLGRVALVRERAVTSARRFREGGILTVFLRDIWLWAHHFLRLPLERGARRYWTDGADDTEARGRGTS
jgi:GT2 family glycosyltransferase